MTGPAVEVWIKDIKINGTPVELYTGDFRIARSGPFAMEIPPETD